MRKKTTVKGNKETFSQFRNKLKVIDRRNKTKRKADNKKKKKEEYKEENSVKMANWMKSG